MEKHASSLEKAGVKVGFGLSYILFTVILFAMLTFLKKIPYTTHSFLLVVGITLAITITGGLIQRFVLWKRSYS